jgi:hypothetical protein
MYQVPQRPRIGIKKRKTGLNELQEESSLPSETHEAAAEGPEPAQAIVGRAEQEKDDEIREEVGREPENSEPAPQKGECKASTTASHKNESEGQDDRSEELGLDDTSVEGDWGSYRAFSFTFSNIFDSWTFDPDPIRERLRQTRMEMDATWNQRASRRTSTAGTSSIGETSGLDGLSEFDRAPEEADEEIIRPDGASQVDDQEREVEATRKVFCILHLHDEKLIKINLFASC